jgi:KaiC/GvpD/RAD55 family RecA-like ATPase
MNLSTGIDELDRRFSTVGRRDEGIPAGSIVVVQSDPGAQCDSLLAAGIDERETYYFTTVRSERAIRESLERASDPVVDRIADVDGDDALERIEAVLDDLGEREELIVDAVDVVEAAAETDEYLAFLGTLSDRLAAADSIALVHGLRDDHTPANRRYTLDVADFVWNVEPVPQPDNGQLAYYLSIRKARGIDLAEDDRMLEIDVGRDFHVDNTRNI